MTWDDIEKVLFDEQKPHRHTVFGSQCGFLLTLLILGVDFRDRL